MNQTRKITFAQAINEALTEEMSHNSAVVLIGDSISSGGNYNVTEKLSERFRKNRIIDLPPSEGSAVGFALGLAMTGARPVVEISGDYLLRAADAIINELAPTDYMYASQYASGVVIRASVGLSPSGNAQINEAIESMFCSVPGINVIYPSTAAEAKGMLKSAIRSEKPTLLLENRNYYDKMFTVPEEEYLVPLGKAEIKLTGEDISIITYGPMTKLCYEACKKASESGISCELIDLRTLSPIDKETIVSSVCKTGKVIIAHEARKTCSLGSEIAAVIAESESFDYLEAPIMRVCGADKFVGYGKKNFKNCIPASESIYRAIMQLIGSEG